MCDGQMLIGKDVCEDRVVTVDPFQTVMCYDGYAQLHKPALDEWLFHRPMRPDRHFRRRSYERHPAAFLDGI